MRSGPALALVQAGAPLSGDVGIVTAVAFSPDGARLASGGSGGDIVVWDVATGAATQRLAGHGGRVSAAAFGPDGGLLITAGDDHTVRVWDAITGDELRRLTGHTGIVLDLAVTPSAADGRHPDHALVATASDDHTVRVWDPATGEELHRLTGQVTPVHAVAFTGDGRHLATGGDDGVVLIWSCATGEVTQLRRAQNVDRVTRIRSLAFDPASSRLAIGGHGFTVTLWDPFTGRETHLPTEIGYPVLSMAFAPDGTFVATASAATAIRVWDATAATVTRGKAVLGTELCAPAYHPVRATGVAVSPDGTHLATGGHDNTTRIWRIAPAVPSDSAGHRRPEHAVHLRRGATLSGHLGHVRCSAFAPDGARVATGGSDGTIRLWNPATGAELDRLIGRDAFREFFVSAGETHDIPLWMLIASPNAVAFSPDGRRLAAACGIDGILVFDLDSGAVVRRMPVASLAGDPHPVAADTVHDRADGAVLVTAFADLTIRLWDAATGAERARLDIDSYLGIEAVAVSPDAAMVAVAGDRRDETVHLADPTTGEELGLLLGHEGRVNAVAMDAGGTLLATAGDDGTVRLWDPATRVPRQVLAGHAGAVRAVTFDRAGRLLATCARDGVRLWETASGAPLGRLDDADLTFAALALDPDGGRLAAAATDRTVRLWDVTPAA